jgi:hypothetical protein
MSFCLLSLKTIPDIFSFVQFEEKKISDSIVKDYLFPSIIIHNFNKKEHRTLNQKEHTAVSIIDFV